MLLQQQWEYKTLGLGPSQRVKRQLKAHVFMKSVGGKEQTVCLKPDAHLFSVLASSLCQWRDSCKWQKTQEFMCLCEYMCAVFVFRGIPKAWSWAHFGQGSGPIQLDAVQCTGNELSLDECPHSGWEQHNCDHMEDAGVSCNPYTGQGACTSNLFYKQAVTPWAFILWRLLFTDSALQYDVDDSSTASF